MGSEEKSGKLVVVGTPIGNLEDIGFRALRALREADFIAAEDTRTTRKLLSRYGIRASLLSYCGEREKEASRRVAGLVSEGKRVALVSESGMPGVSDPGWMAVRACREAGLAVEVVPGPSALTAAISLAGLPPGPVYFHGFLPSRAAARRKLLGELALRNEAMVFYESPHRLRACLSDLAEALGERRLALMREMTKLHEEVREGSASRLLEELGEEKVRGECVLVVWPGEGGEEKGEADWDELVEAVRAEVEKGTPMSEACSRAAAAGGVSRRELYSRFLRAVPE